MLFSVCYCGFSFEGIDFVFGQLLSCTGVNKMVLQIFKQVPETLDNEENQNLPFSLALDVSTGYNF